MYITIDESDRRPVYRQVADEIKGLIARGELREGMALRQCVRWLTTWA